MTARQKLVAEIARLKAENKALRGGVKQPGTAYTKRARKVKPVVPSWIVEHAHNRANRRALAAEMRAAGVEPTGDAWKQAKAAAGIK